MIIHISGTPASGKTTLGEKIQDEYPNINWIDTDYWLNEYLDTHNNPNKYIEFMEDKFKTLDDNKINLLTGIFDIYYKGKNYMPKLNADYKFYIKIPLHQLYLQLNNRSLNWILENPEIVKDDIINGRPLNYFKSLGELKEDQKRDEKPYKILKYKFLTSEQIYNEIKNIIY